MIMGTISKEVCGCCSKNINLGQSITECTRCDSIIHTKCYKKSSFGYINSKTYCLTCSDKVNVIYNPFENINKLRDPNDCHESDKFYEDDLSEIFQDFSTISNLLNICSALASVPDLNRFVTADKIQNTNFSTFFQNVDGNKSNFDSFAVNVHQMDHLFSVIGLAETNVDPANKDLYMLDGYISYYQDIHPDKAKGTGVAMYVHNSLNSMLNKNLSHTSQNLETLFITIPVNSQNITVGTLYRPPNGNFNEFLDELRHILESCPSRFLYIMGDFNVDLHKLDNDNAKAYEELILTSGIFPLISVSTHSQPNCRETCIDNILTNEPETVITSGAIRDSVSNHHSIFQFTSITHSSSQKEVITQFYDFCNSNIDIFVEQLQTALAEEHNDTSSFSDFLEIYSRKIEEVFKLEKPKMSKRNAKNNPWFIDSLNISILQ